MQVSLKFSKWHDPYGQYAAFDRIIDDEFINFYGFPLANAMYSIKGLILN